MSVRDLSFSRLKTVSMFFCNAKEGVLVAQCLVDGGDKYLLDVAFRDRAGVAEQAGVFQATDAAPDDGFLPTVVPVNPAKYLATVTEYNHLGEDGSAKMTITWLGTSFAATYTFRNNSNVTLV